MRNVSVQSLVVTRTRSLSGWKISEKPDEKLGETETETLISSRALSGVLPQALLERYRFWRTGPRTIRGYRITKDGEGYFHHPSLLIMLQTGQDGGEEGKVEESGGPTVALVTRLKRGGRRDVTLMNVDHTAVVLSGKESSLRVPSTLSDFRKGIECLSRLSSLFSRVDNLSHVLLWTKSDGAVGDYCEITRVELPRVQACFELKGRQLCSMDHDGLRVSQNPPAHVLEHMRGLRNSLIMENRNGEHFVLVPNYGIKPVKVQSAPFTTAVTLNREFTPWCLCHLLWLLCKAD